MAGCALMAILAGLTYGTALAQTASSAKKKVIWTYGSTNDVDSMNQFIMVSTGYIIHSMAYDTLTTLGVKDFSPQPDIAESWTTSPDGLTWTYHIRSGMKWSDGVPLTAHDVAYTYNRVLSEHQGCCTGYLEGADSITAPDDNTVIIHLKAPNPNFGFIYIYIYPEHIWKNITKQQAKTEENFPGVTSGPFHPVEWKKGQFMRLVANKDYWAGAPHVDEIDWRVFNNLNAAVEALKSGEIDFVDAVTPNLFNSLKNAPGVGVHAATTTEWDDIAINSGGGNPQGDPNPALKDPRFRKALAMAVDKKELVDKVLLGYGSPGTTIVPPLLAAYHAQVPASQLIPFDIAGANTLLDQAGYKDTDGNGIRNLPNGGPDIVLRYYLVSSIDATVPTAQLVKNWFQQIGVGTTVKSYGDNKLTDIEWSGKYDLAQWDFFSDPDPDFILSVATCGQRPKLDANGTNQGGIWSDTYYCDPTYDQQYLQQKTLALSQRAPLIKQMQLELYNAVNYIILWYPSDLQAYNTDFTGFQPQPAKIGDLTASYGNTGWRSIRPVSAAAGQTKTKGISAGVWVAIAAVVVVLVGGVVLVRRRRGHEDVE
jgi:peptide/nickel transport system substrate-binding protein